MRRATIAIIVVGAFVGVVAVKDSLTFIGSVLAIPFVLFPYVLVFLISGRAKGKAVNVALLAMALAFTGLSAAAMSPSTDAQGGLIVLVVPAIQGAAAIAAYLALRLTGGLTASGTEH